MRTHCKPKNTNIESTEFNAPAVHKCFAGKLKKKEFRQVLINTGKITAQEIAQERANNSCNKIIVAIDAVAEQVTQKIRDRELGLKPVRQFQRRDGISQKLRDINQESAEQQIFEYIAVDALMPLFKAKILPCQVGSIPGKGQTAGKRQIERVLRKKFHNTRVDEIKGDVHHAYQSVTIECVMFLMGRDIGKNKPLLWFIRAVMSNYPNGCLMIGGYLPTWLYNYVMSYVLRYLMSLHHSRRGVRHNYVIAVVCYADDFAIFGKRSNLKKALKDCTRWAKETLGLSIKNVWNFTYFASIEQEKDQYKKRKSGSRERTPGLDMMGYVVRRTYTIIRGRIFVRIRRQLLRAKQDLDTLGYIPYYRAYKVVAHFGWLKNSDSQKFRIKHSVKKIMKAAKMSVSRISKQRAKEDIERERKLCERAAYC